ncbi:MAG: hypothetical protein K8F62_02175 [Pseudorhodoplanes sp.]|nr:hypothetical protein [Pseudorhodoplanes sp.]
MLKVFTAIASAALIAAAVVLVPGMNQEVAASTPDPVQQSVTAIKGDRLAVKALATPVTKPVAAKPAAKQLPATCAQQHWPYLDQSCLRNAALRQVRLVSADRLH